MRDKDRIHRILELIENIWNRVSDWRLGQLLYNLADFQDDIFVIEDNITEEKLSRIKEKWFKPKDIHEEPERENKMKVNLVLKIDKVSESDFDVIVKTANLEAISKFNSALLSGDTFDFILVGNNEIIAARNCVVNYMRMDGSRIVLKKRF